MYSLIGEITVELSENFGFKINTRSAICTVLTIALQSGSYWLAQFIIRAFELELHSPAIWLDGHIPFVPAFLIPYIGCFIHWLATFYIIYRDEDGFARLFTAAVMGYAAGFIVFICWPTTMQRPVIEAEGVWRFIYTIICTLDEPLNLLPSIHCFVSFLCCVSTIKSSSVPRWYAAFSTVMLMLVCLSTLFVKQHCVLDVFAGVALGSMAWLLAKAAILQKPARRIYNSLVLTKIC